MGLGSFSESSCSPSLETLVLAGGQLLVKVVRRRASQAPTSTELQIYLSKWISYLEFGHPKLRFPWGRQLFTALWNATQLTRGISLHPACSSPL